MRPAALSSRQPADRLLVRCIRGGLAWCAILSASVLPARAAAEVTYQSSCEVVDTARLESFGRDGQPAQVSHFSCRITGGPLDGAIVAGTNIWDMADKAGGTLLGSIAVAQRAGASVMYELRDVTRTLKTHNGHVVGWEAKSRGVYKAASGSAAALEGKTFNSIARFTGPRTYTISSTINE